MLMNGEALLKTILGQLVEHPQAYSVNVTTFVIIHAKVNTQKLQSDKFEPSNFPKQPWLWGRLFGATCVADI